MASDEAKPQQGSSKPDPAPGAESGRAVNAYSPDYIEGLYLQWKQDAASVGEDWNRFFLGFELGQDAGGGGSEPISTAHSLQGRVDSLIYHYRDIGHLAANLDPLGIDRPFPRSLTLETFTLSDANLDESFDPGTLPLPNPTPLRKIIELLEETYCRHIGVEYMHIQDRERRRWLQQRMEPVRNRPDVDTERKHKLLQNLINADGFEAFLRKRYVGKKRFGLEGGDSLIPLLDQIIECAQENNVSELAIGMAHRGRLNVLANILDKTFDQIFTEFEEAWTEDYLDGGGDVKYHQGYSTDRMTSSGEQLHLTLAPNPSHLEFVTSVVLGRCRAKQRLMGDTEREQVIPLMIHGDAAFPGQGVVAECFNMMKLDGYTVGGTLHVVLNNQVGFTTEPHDAFSGLYCTDIAKMIDAPIFHVNGEDPEACAWVAQLALEYRQAFKNDVVIDMWCYRRHGHNETDEPSFTQPLMYKLIREKRPVVEVYRDELIEQGELTEEEFEERYTALGERLEEAQARTKENPVDPLVDPFQDKWAGLRGEFDFDSPDTSVDLETIEKIARAIASTPDSFKVHKTIERGLKARLLPTEGLEGEVDWATAELLAYGSLLLDGHAVRLTGQDVERGTFSHRHSVLYDQETGEAWTGLNEIDPGQAKFCVHNTPLTECAIVGFEYGYSLADPKMLIIWEAQFGDFGNGAQVIFDQFMASAELKWQRFSGLVLFLPHGYEGQGPEHSSARMERFLDLCADQNMQVCYPTTAAQLFHMLRRQILQPFRKPLVVMTPKSMLRLPWARCTTRDLVEGSFKTILDDAAADPSKVRELILCSGKVYHDLDARRKELKRDDLAIVRVEQLYPLDLESLKRVLARYGSPQNVIWVQEEPENSGAWRFMNSILRRDLGLEPEYIGRDENASPAVGSSKVSNQEHEVILTSAVGPPSAPGSEAAGAKSSKSPSRKSTTPRSRGRGKDSSGKKKKAS